MPNLLKLVTVAMWNNMVSGLTNWQAARTADINVGIQRVDGARLSLNATLQANVDTYNATVAQLLTNGGISAQYVSLTTANPTQTGPDGTAGLRLGSGGGWQRLIVQGGAWVPVGPEVAGRESLAPRIPSANIYLDIPTQDGDPNVRHPDVLYIPGGWNGYSYWMGYTPYPGPPRENPAVVASHDGVTWVKPVGAASLELLSNAQIQAMGYLYGSDTDLVLTPQNKLRIYYRLVMESTPNPALNREAIYFQESADGRTWGAPVKTNLDLVSVGRIDLLSPSTILEADNTYSMWYVARNVTPGSLMRVTSADGVTWSAPVACNLNGAVPGFLWHAHVERVGARYYQLHQSAAQELYYLESADGQNWTGSGRLAVPANIDPTGTYTQQYRSCLLPRPGGRFDVYLGLYRPGDGASRLMLLKDVTLPLNSERYMDMAGATYKATNGTLNWSAAAIFLGSTITLNTGTYGVGIGNKVAVTGANAIAIGTDAKALSVDAVVLGARAVANNGFSLALGAGAVINGTNGMALGKDSVSAGGIALGVAANAGSSGIAIGHNVTTTAGANMIVIGPSATGTGASCTVLGPSATAAGSSVSLGASTSALGVSTTAVGPGANASGNYSLAAGKGALSSGVTSTAIGVDSVASSTFATALGNAAQATIGSATALGKGAIASHTSSTALGVGAATSAANQMMLGTVAETVYVPGKLQLAGIIKHNVYTIATLPSSSASGLGAEAFISDPAATKSAKVYSNGSSWRYVTDGSAV